MHAPVVEPLDAGSTCLPIERVVVRTDLYPRSRHDPALVQRYAENIENLPPIEVNQYGHLIDGYHRYLAYRLREKTEIPVIVTETSSDEELLALAAQRNAAHGWQLTDEDKKYVAVRLYGAGTGRKKEEIAKIPSHREPLALGYRSRDRRAASADDLRDVAGLRQPRRDR
jgi:hypothetical protein